MESRTRATGSRFRHSMSRLLLGVAAAAALLSAPASATSSSKRGLVYTPNAQWPQDNYKWTQSPSDLTWYYNYGPSPSSVFNNLTQDKFEFVPQLWGAISDNSFYTTVKALRDKGTNITHVLTFNEPDANYGGGSGVDPKIGAITWVNNIIPLQKLGVKVGLPACTGGWGGIPWLNQFLANCSALISTDGNVQNCTYDFLGIHWYDNFEGLASHIGTYVAAFPGTPVWVTEYNYADQDLATTQSYYNTSAAYMDRLTEVERYSLFGAFRSSVANVGPNGAMLSAGGKLTDIGAWYLGRSATGVDPKDTANAAPKALVQMGWSMASVFAVMAVLAL